MRMDLRSIAKLGLAVLFVLSGCEEPFDKAAALRKAQKSTQERKYDEAIPLLREVIARFPDDVEPRFQLGLALALSNRPLDGRLELMQVIDRDSTRADALEHLGMLAFGAEDRAEAIEMLERAVKMGAQKVQLYDTLSYLHFQEGTIEEAKKWMHLAIQADPRDPRFRLKLATLSHFIGAYEESRDTLEPLVRDYPTYWDAHLLAGKVYRQLGENEKALASLNKALAKMKGHLEFTQELGMVKLKTGDPNGAIEAFEKVILQSPETGEAHYGLGQAYMKKGEREKAKSALERFREMQQTKKALKNKQAKFISNWQEGLVKEKEGDFDGAYASFEESLTYKQGDVGTQILMWLLKRNQGRTAEAARMYRTVERLMSAQGRDFKDVAFTLAERLVKKDCDQKAVEVYVELLKRYPDDRGVRYQLVRTYGRLGLDKEREAQFEIFRSGKISEPAIDAPVPEKDTAATAFDAGYIGAEACAQCHKDRYETFVETAHHRTSAAALSESILGSFETGENILKTNNENLRFEMTRDGDQFFQTAYTKGPSTERKRKESFDFVLGSGKLGQTYLYWDRDRLFQLPISYMTSSDSWINSPGYKDGEANFSRPVAPRCLECHATAFEVDSYTTNEYTKGKHILGISCERCHGPGSKHFEYQMEGAAEGSPYIVVPSKLSPERSMDICAQCHSGAGVQAFGKPFSHRAGADLSDHYKLKDAETQNQLGVHAANQIARLGESKCFRESEAMTCVDCHNPHVNERGNLKLFSDRCLKCHESFEACGLSDHLGAGIAENCVDCHVPQKHDLNMGFDTKEGFQFQQMRDHNIGIYEDVSASVSERMGKPLSPR
jgi:tetratricopeptide (TPR) repeat protein